MSIPIITSLTPNSVNLNTATSVTIAGSNLDNLSSVLFGTITAQITSSSATQITVNVPSQSTDQSVDVYASNNAGTNTPNINSIFTFGSPTPTITSIGINPPFIPISGNLTITGTNFNSTSVVKNYNSFGVFQHQLATTPISSTSLSISYTSSNISVSAYPPTFKVSNGSNISNSFTYYPVSIPGQIFLSAPAGQVNTQITLTSANSNVLKGPVTIIFGATTISQSLSPTNPNFTTFNVPNLDTGTYQVSLYNINGPSYTSTVVPFTITTPPGKPTITNVQTSTPASAIVSFSAPTSGGSVSYYKVTANPGNISVNTPDLSTTISNIGTAAGTLYVFTVTAYNALGPGQTSDGVSATVFSNPVSSQLTASKAIITNGGELYLTPYFSGSTTQYITYPDPDGTIQVNVSTSGTAVQIVSPPVNATTTYTLYVANTSWTAAEFATCQVQSVAQANITSFTATPNPVATGIPVILNAVFTGGTAQYCVNGGSYSAFTNGMSVTPSDDTTYTLKVTNLAGDFTTMDVLVSVYSPANVDAQFKNCNFTVSNSNTFFDLSYQSSLVLTDNEFVAENSDANFTFVPAQSTGTCSLKYYNNSYSTSNPDADVSVLIPSSGETGWNNINQLVTEPIGIVGSTGSIIIGGNGNKTGYNDILQVLNDGSTGYIQVSGSIVPSSGNVFSLGATGAQFAEIFMGPGTLNIAGPPGSTGVAKLGADSQGIAFTENGFSTPFINVGPSADQLSPTAVGGWNIKPQGTQGDGPDGTPGYNLVAQENSPLGGLVGPIHSMLVSPIYLLWVSPNGSDNGNGSFTAPFMTISRALTAASQFGSVNSAVWVMPGTYNESIVIPSNVTVRGHNLQSCIISQTNVYLPTTAVTMGSNSRLEDMTVNVSSIEDFDITGVLFPDGTAKTAKLRTVVVNVTNVSGGSANICCGVKCTDSTTNNVVSSFNAIQRMTINAATNCVAGAKAYAILNNSNAYFSIRDSTLFATGTSGAQCIGVLSSGASGYTSVKTSTCSGSTYDIDRINGSTLLLSATDLQNASSNGNGFSVNIQPSFMSFGLFGNIANATHNLAPGTISIGNQPDSPYQIYFPSSTIIFQATAYVSPALGTSQTISIKFFKNSPPTGTPFLTITLTSESQKIISTGFSTTITSNDYLTSSVTCSGGITNGSIVSCTISLY